MNDKERMKGLRNKEWLWTNKWGTKQICERALELGLENATIFPMFRLNQPFSKVMRFGNVRLNYYIINQYAILPCSVQYDAVQKYDRKNEHVNGCKKCRYNS